MSLTAAASGNPVPKLKLDQSSGNTLNSSQFTAMCWAYHTGGTADSYQDIISLRDSTIGGGASDDQYIGMGTHVVSAVRVVNLGDVDTDADSTITIPDNVWFHYTMVGEKVPDSAPAPTQRVRLIGYLNGAEAVRSADTVMRPPIFPDTDCWVQFFNSRSSETDAASVWIGSVAAIKIWNNIALTPEEIMREMQSYMPVRTRDIWACLPLINKTSAGYNYYGSNFTVQGASFSDGTLDPPGVAWDYPDAKRHKALIVPPSLIGPFPTYLRI